MRRSGLLIALSWIVAFGPGGHAAAQVAGSTRLGVAVEELRTVALGWSAKKQILGQPVYNEKNEKVGSIDDIIVAPDSSRCPTPSSARADSSVSANTTSRFRLAS